MIPNLFTRVNIDTDDQMCYYLASTRRDTFFVILYRLYKMTFEKSVPIALLVGVIFSIALQLALLAIRVDQQQDQIDRLRREVAPLVQKWNAEHAGYKPGL